MAQAALQTKIRRLAKRIKDGEYKGRKLASAEARLEKMRTRLKNSKKKVKAAKTTRRRRKHVVQKDQGFLPNFLSQMNMVRVEELVADRIFNKLERTLDQAFESTRKVG